MAGEVFMDAEDDRRKNGMFDGVRRLEAGGGPLLAMGGLVAEFIA